MEETDCLAQLKAHEALQYDELKTVIRKFNSLNIPVMLIKGAVDLAVPDNCPPGSLPRDRGDLDLLIQKQDWKKAVQGLNDSGYCPLISSEKDSFAPPDIGQMDFVRSEPDGRIDLHYNMNKNQRVEGLFIIEEMWQRSKPVEFEGVSALVPSISDQFWIRLVHFFLLHTCSLQEMMGDSGHLQQLIDFTKWNCENISWDEIIRKARDHNLEILIYLVWYGIKQKYRNDPPFQLNKEIYKHASFLWEWMKWAKRIPAVLNYAVGRFNNFSLFLNYSFPKTCGIFYIEMVKGLSKDVLFEKYRLPWMTFLSPAVIVMHLMRFVLLHLIIKMYYLRFLRMKKRNSFIKTDRNVEDIEMISNDYRPKGREDLHKEDLEDGCALYDPKTSRVYTLNTTAALVWEYCDENHTLKQIAGEVAPACELTVDEVMEDVRNIILDFQNKRLLSFSS